MPNFREIVTEIKSKISCVDFAKRNGLSIKYAGDRCVSPLRHGASNSTSFVVNDQHWYDFGAGQGGDVIDLAALLLYDGDKGKAIRELSKIAGIKTGNYEWVKFTQNLCAEIQMYHEALLPDDRTYLRRRGITDETINRIKIGRTKNGRLCFPYWKNGYICYYATRAMPGGAYPDSKYMKMNTKQNPMCDHTIWGLHTVDRANDTLVIAEGAFDALSFDQEGYPVISAITGHFSADQLPTALSIAKQFKNVFLVYDNDAITKAGEKFTIKMVKILTENRIPCTVGSVPPTYKDISEYYADGGKLSDVISQATDGITFLALHITDTDEFETFAQRVCRYMSKPSVELFFKEVAKTDTFDPDWLKALCAECKKAPPDDVVAKEILAKHKLLYNPSVSFFEYNGRFWDKQPDQAVEKYIKLALGTYATGQRLSSIIRLIKAQVVTTQLFNMNPVMNFINGTLELTDTEPYYIFREHRDTDYCTYVLQYPYVPSIKSKEWDAFIESVTDGDSKRASFLQEYAGYVMFPDNRLQKCACLVGSGANGKSIYFNTLSQVFGSENVTTITMSKLSQDFQAVHLLGSMLNISSENKSDVYGAEEVFKQVVAGDDVFACYKGKDYIKFKPRCKMILSLNNYPKITDRSDGFTRRLAFVEFPLKFVEYPQAENERPLDRSLEDKFKPNEQLTRIFNWVLDGYLMVRRCGYLTETDEQGRVLDEFKEESDPTIIFAKEVEIKQRVTNAQLYDLYKYWCIDNGYKPESRNTVVKAVAKHLREYRHDVKPFTSNGTRGFEPQF